MICENHNSFILSALRFIFRQNHYLTFAYITSPDSTKIAAPYELNVKGWLGPPGIDKLRAFGSPII